METTIGNLLVNEALPEELRDYQRVWDKNTSRTVLRELAEKHPEDYPQILQRLMRVGQSAATSGDFSFSLKDFSPTRYKIAETGKLKMRVKKIEDNERLTTEQKNDKVTTLLAEQLEPMIKNVLSEAKKSGSRLADVVSSGSKGSPLQFNSTVGSPLLFVDHKDRPIPIPIYNSISQGFDPVEYWASSYGTRKGVICLDQHTEVLMSDYSVKQIKDIRCGELVMGANDDGTWTPSEVSSVYDNGQQPMYEYTFRKNKSQSVVRVTATEQHKLYARLWKAGTRGATRKLLDPELRPLGDAGFCKRASHNGYVAVSTAGAAKDLGTVDEPLAPLIGAMLGDGCTAPSTRGRYSLSCADKSLLSELESEQPVTFEKTGSGYSYVLRADDWVLDHVEAVVGECLAHEKTLPAKVMEWNDRSVGGLLAYLIATDGCLTGTVNTQWVTITMTAGKLIYQLKQLLEWRYGIWCNAVIVIPAASKEHAVHDQFELTITHRDSISKLFKLVERIPGVKHTAESKFRLALSKKPSNYSAHGFRIQSKTFVGFRHAYDLEIDHHTHMFVLASGLITSNSTKFATADAGYFGKKVALSAQRTVVTEDDCGTTNGVPVVGDDHENVGTILQKDAGGIPAGTILMPEHVKKLGTREVVVRSPLTCQAENGICARCSGIREGGNFPEVGSNIGITAASTLSERLSQGMLNVKHTAGAAKGGKQDYTFQDVDKLFEMPKTDIKAAPVAEVDGIVKRISPSPTGGVFVSIGDDEHWAPSMEALQVKVGDQVEAGDVLATGIPNPSLIARYRGIGDARRTFVNSLLDVTNNKITRRNAEVIARGVVSHVRITGQDGPNGTMQGDMTRYDNLVKGYEPRENSTEVPLYEARNQYLEQPVLHHTIGTRVSSRLLKDLKTHGIKSILVNKEQPGFEPDVRRTFQHSALDPDWMTRLGGFNVKSTFLQSVHRGGKSEQHSTSYVPSLAKGIDFGEKTDTQGTY